MQLEELLARLPGDPPGLEAIDRCLLEAPPLNSSQRSQLRGYSLAALEPEDFYGVALYLRKQKPEGTISLAEVPLSEVSRAWLLEWPRRVSPRGLASAMQSQYLDPSRGCRGSECLALTLLWFAAEWGREHAEDGEIWTCVAPAFDPEGRGHLFAQGQPRSALKVALEQCCQRFDLRHAFGREGAQAYYQTVYMQFGLTRRSLRHLSSWMSGSASPRVVTLLREQSESFAQLWNQLRRVHEGRAEARSLAGHPFLPKGWLPEAGASQSPVRLVWTPQGEVEGLVDLGELFGEVPQGHYELTDEADLWHLVTVSDSGWEPARLSLPLQPASWLLRSLSESERVFAASLELPDEEVLLWDEVGRLRAGEGRPRKDWTARVRSDWQVLSPSSAWVRQPPWAYARILEGPLRLLDQDGCEVAWELAESPLRELQLRLESHQLQRLPNQVRGLLLHLPEGCRLQSAQTSAGTACHHEFLQDFELELPVDVALERPVLTLRVRAQDERRKTWTRTLSHPLDLEAITWNPQGQWELFQDQKQAEVAVLEGSLFRFFLSRTDLALLEGDHYLGRPPTRTAPLTGLLGLGGPLQLRPGPYNSSANYRVLVHSLQNQGLCQHLGVDGSRFALQLRRPIYADPDFALIWWNGQDPPVTQSLSAASEPQRQLEGELPLAAPALVALSFRGRRLGAYWKGFELQGLGGFDSPREAMLFLRWLQLPWLEWTWEMILRERLRGSESCALLAWTQEAPLSLSQVTLHCRPTEAMLPVARRMFANQSWTGQQAWELLREVPWNTLMHIHPRLLLNLLEKSGANQEMRVIARELQTAGGVDGLWGRAASEMGVDRKWLEHCCERYFAGVKADGDLSLALSCSAFRELVTALALE